MYVYKFKKDDLHLLTKLDIKTVKNTKYFFTITFTIPSCNASS